MKPMLAKDAVLEKLVFPVCVQDKLDGIRVVIVDGVALSRTLKPIPNREVQAALGRHEFNGLDGEIIVGEQTADDCYRRTASFVMAPAKRGEPWAFMVFDKWDDGGSFQVRWDAAQVVVDATTWTDLPMFMLAYEACADMDSLEALEAEALAAGHEGVIVRGPGPYKFGRSYPKDGTLLKVKRFSDSEAVILGSVEEQHNTNEAKTNALGRTERSSAKAGKVGKGTLGKLLVRDCYSGVEFSIGTGFTADERADLWARRDAIVGSVVKYKHFEIGAKDKPRHPVMLGFRHQGDIGVML